MGWKDEGIHLHSRYRLFRASSQQERRCLVSIVQQFFELSVLHCFHHTAPTAPALDIASCADDISISVCNLVAQGTVLRNTAPAFEKTLENICTTEVTRDRAG